MKLTIISILGFLNVSVVANLITDILSINVHTEITSYGMIMHFSLPLTIFICSTYILQRLTSSSR